MFYFMLLETKSEALPDFAGACSSNICYKEWETAGRNWYAAEVLECGEQRLGKSEIRVYVYVETDAMS